jgi:hypothetical protein
MTTTSPLTSAGRFTSKLPRVLTIAALAFATTIGTTTLASPAQAASPFYELVGLGSNKCVDIRIEDGAVNGARAQLWKCYGSPNQRFTLQQIGRTSTGRPYFQIISKAAPNLCLEVRDSSHSNGAQVDQSGCSQDGNKFWYWGSPNQGVNLPLVNLNSGKCLDVNANSTANGARVQQWDCNRTTAQLWKTIQ